MVLYLCIVPNRGARVGHQFFEHLAAVAYCKQYGFNFVYHRLLGSSSTFEPVLNLGDVHENTYDNTKDRVDEIRDFSSHQDVTHEFLMQIHSSPKLILAGFDVCLNQKIMDVLWKRRVEDVDTAVQLYRKKASYPRVITGDYICIHVRCGDVIDDPTRFLDANYFLNQYTTYLSSVNLPVYIVSELNFKDGHILTNSIPNSTHIQTDEITSFYILVHSTYLVASRSGFSCLAYAMGGMKVVKHPTDWNHYELKDVINQDTEY